MWQPGWEGSLGENGYMYIIQRTESLCCLPETITALLTGCTPIEDKKFFFFLKYKIKGYGKSTGTHLKINFKMLKIHCI